MAVPDLLSLLSLLALVRLAAAHGYVNQVAIDGQFYPGNPPGRLQNASAIRMVSSVNPVQNTSSPDMACGLDGQPAQLDAAAAPGSAVTFNWVSGSGGHWFHATGPILTYMASCGEGSTSCSTFDTSGARWFKIDESGKKSDNTTWVQQDLDNGANYTVHIPECLAPGAYIIRNEIISLQNGMSKGGTEFYPSCTQLMVPGDGTCVPPNNETVSFPGAYSPTNPGILVDVYTTPHAGYVFPGPPVANLVPQDEAANPSADSAPTESSTMDAPTPTESSAMGAPAPTESNTPDASSPTVNADETSSTASSPPDAQYDAPAPPTEPAPTQPHPPMQPDAPAQPDSPVQPMQPDAPAQPGGPPQPMSPQAESGVERRYHSRVMRLRHMDLEPRTH